MSTLNSESACHWLFFAEDWRLSPLGPDEDGYRRTALAAHSGGMAALIDTQQEVSAQLKEARHLKPCRQFSATYKITDWQPDDLAIQTTPVSNGLDYVYSACGRTCFKGSFSSVWTPDGGGIYGAKRTYFDPGLTLYKLDQFKTLFPHVSYFWVFLSAFTSGHFLHQHYSALPAGAITTHPQLLGYKTQFDPLAVERTFRAIGSARLSYSVSSLSVGKYNAFTLGIYAGETLLMRTEMGVLKVTQEVTDLDIVLH